MFKRLLPKALQTADMVFDMFCQRYAPFMMIPLTAGCLMRLALMYADKEGFTAEEKAQILEAYDAGLSVDISICDAANIDDAINEWVQQHGANNATKADIDSLMKGKGGTT